MNEYQLECIGKSAAYRQLTERRSALSWTLSIIQTAIFFGFLLLVAFKRDFLGTPFPGSVTTIGIPLALLVSLGTVILTAIYVHRANSEFDELNTRVWKEAGHE